MVVDHLTGNTRLLSSGVVPDTDEYKLLLLPMMWTCQNFRAIASARFYRVNAVKIDGSNFIENFMRYSRSRRLQKLYRSSGHPAQEVHIRVDKQSVFYGKALEALSKVPYEGRAFQQARMFRFEFYYEPWQNEAWHKQQFMDESTVTANINEFVCRFKQMAPTLSWIEVCYERSMLDLYRERASFDLLLAQLLRITPRITFWNLRYPIPASMLVDGIANLVHIDMEAESIGVIAQLARQNATTLQYLHIETEHPQSPSELVKDANGDFVCYPRLRVLKLNIDILVDPSERLEFPGAVPFPILRSLSIKGGYPLDDDMFFRGNSATLESLVLEAEHDDIVKLVDRGVFTPTSHPKLRHVIITLIEYYEQDTVDVDKEQLWLLLSIAPNAAARSILGSNQSSMICSAISIFGGFPNIQILDISDVRLELWEAITLINSLPLLSDLHTEVVWLSEFPTIAQADELPIYVLAKYAPMGQRFRCWHVNGYGLFANKTVECVLLVALICPNFDYCVPPKDQFAQFMEELETCIRLDEFKDHEPRLRRLLFNK
ncbi:hypothetical protein IW146_004365 [Coemansia sp. RSA 922]|nr:hypothetical protein IW146_004365 [Coemansia sp. RSA 922]KAJ2351620.1 hypothetical protein GGH92_001726 [Coemansia sp. RSA 2673]